MGESSGSHILAEKIRVLLDAFHAAEKNGECPDNHIILQIMRDVIAPHLCAADKQN
ncbi:MAG: hypothetical protein OXT65_08360 [Alphaproteobacteria bacterium]|nr:hypothetical protein [Alphaproteobacteria bacterium]